MAANWPGGNLGQRVVSLEFLDDELDRRTVVVQPVDGQRPNAQVGHEGVIAVPTDREQRGLRALLLGEGLADHYKAIGVGPAVRLIGTIGDR